MSPKFLLILGLVCLFQGSLGDDKLNFGKVYVEYLKQGLMKVLPGSISHDLMDHPFNTIKQILSDSSVKSCTEHLLSYVRNPKSSSIPNCVDKNDLQNLQKVLDDVMKLPKDVSGDCQNILTGNFDACKQSTIDKGKTIMMKVWTALKNINGSCGSYVSTNKEALKNYYLGGCQGPLPA